MLQQVISQSIIPILIGVVFLFFAIRVLVFKDTWMMRGRNKPEPKDKEGFCKEAGMILLFSSVAAFAVAVLEVIDPFAGFTAIILWAIVMTSLWKKINDKYY